MVTANFIDFTSAERNVQVLNDAEKAWVDTYHKEVWEKVSSMADGFPY
jgi:C-terminal region of peptidase_M24